MGLDSTAYQIVLVLHLIAVIVGFGGLALNGYQGAVAASLKGRGGAVVGDSVDKGYSLVEWFIYAVPILGIVLVMLSDDVFKFSQLWITLAFVLYIVILGLLHGLQLPTVRRINALLAEMGAAGGTSQQAAEVDRLGSRAGLVGGVLNLLLAASVVVMVFKPGFP